MSFFRISSRAFLHRSSEGGSSSSTYFPEEGVSVSALRFVPQLAAVAAGFNFGSWQLWSVAACELEYRYDTFYISVKEP